MSISTIIKSCLVLSLSALTCNLAAADYPPVAEFIGTIPGNPNPPTTDTFGSAVCLNGDFAFVAAPLARPDGQIAQGAVYVYKRNKHGEWVMDPYQIISLPGVSHHLGLFSTVSDEDWLFLSCVGTPVQDTGAPVGDFKGAVLVYKYSHSSKLWELHQQIDSTTVPQLANLIAISPQALNPTNQVWSFEQGASFGLSLSVDVEKGRLIAGAQYQTTDANVINVGAAYAFELKHNQWQFSQLLTNPDGLSANDNFGAQVAIRGKVALISNGSVFQAPRRDNSAVYVYIHDDGEWQFRQKVQGDANTPIPITFVLYGPANINIGNTFGSALAIDDDWAVIASAFENNGTSSPKGAVYFFKVNHHSSTPLTFFQKVTSTDLNPTAQFFGMTSVAVRNKHAVVSNISQTGPTGVTFQGGANVYKYKNGQWNLETVLFDPFGQDANFFGGSVSLTSKHIIVGAGFQGINSIIVGQPPLAFLPPNPDGGPYAAQPPFRHAVIYEID